MSESIRIEKTFLGWGGYTDKKGGFPTIQLVMQGPVHIGTVFSKRGLFIW